jgi:hypothetical protein
MYNQMDLIPDYSTPVLGANVGRAAAQPQGLVQGLMSWGRGQRQEGGLLTGDRFLGNPMTGAPGWGQLALGAAGGLASSYLGMKQYGLAKQQLAEARRQFDLNYNTQRKMLNTQMEDRQAARVASNPTAYQSVGDYMQQNRI